MKLKSLTTVIALAATTLTASASMAEDVTVYGKVNVSLNKLDYEVNGDDKWELESNASRFGIKGSYEINEHLKAIYKLEYEISVDGDDDEFKQRNIYGGFQGNWGTLIAGKHDTPTKIAAAKVDRFNDLANGDIKSFFAGENRVGNTIMYTTPKMSGFSATIAAIQGEDTNEVDGPTDGASLALTYRAEGFFVALAHDSDVTSKDINGDKYLTEITRLVGEITFGDLKIGAMVQDAEATDEGVDVQQNGYLLSSQYKIDQWVLKAQYGTTENDIYFVDVDATQIAIGADYKLNKRSKLFAYYSAIEYDTSDGMITIAPENQIVGIGYEIKF